MTSELGVFQNELTDHSVVFKTGPEGFFTDLVCPDDCVDRPWHQDDWAGNGADLIIATKEEIVIGVIPVNPEIRRIKSDLTTREEDEELWFVPVVPEGE